MIRKYIGLALIACISQATGCAAANSVKSGVEKRLGKDDKLIAMQTDIEAGLLELGFAPGIVDGVIDLKTETAIQNFQLENDIRINGRASPALLKEIRKVIDSRD